HVHILIYSLQNNKLIVQKLISLSSQLNTLVYSSKIFQNSLHLRVITYNTMIKCFIGNTHPYAFRIYNRMKALVAPNSFTFNFLLRCLESFQSLKHGMVIHGEIFKLGFDSSVFVQNTLLNFYVKCCENLAWSIFCRMPKKTVVSCTTLMSGYIVIGDLEFAGDIFYQMPVKYVVAWNAMITGYVPNHMFDQAHSGYPEGRVITLSVFHHMLINGTCRPNQSTLISLLIACSHLGSHEHGKWIDSYIKHKLELSIPLGNPLIDMFANCGDLQNAQAFF
ncbi:LOW QUALITY PROTEIN: PPR domain-containing protein, partial [Cephalotus follicularis]